MSQTLKDKGFFVEVDVSSTTLQKRIAVNRDFNYIVVVGQKEYEGQSVNLRSRDGSTESVSIEEMLLKFDDLRKNFK